MSSADVTGHKRLVVFSPRAASLAPFGSPQFSRHVWWTPGFSAASSTEEEFVQFALTQYTRRFPESEEWDESAKHDQGAGEQLTYRPIIDRKEGRFSKHKFLNCLFENAEGRSKQAEYERFVKGRHDQCRAFMSSTKVCVFAQQNNFGQYERADQSTPVIEVPEVELIQEEHAISGKRAEK